MTTETEASYYSDLGIIQRHKPKITSVEELYACQNILKLKPENLERLSKELKLSHLESEEIENITEDLTPLKRIDVVPNKIISTRITIADISPGVNLLKGYRAICPVCQRIKVVYTQNKATCSTVFSTELKAEKAEACRGARGGDVEVIFESINDTGYFCTAFDPQDNGAAQQFSSVFFSNSIIPNDKNKRETFETAIQSDNLIVKAKIIPLPSTKKVTEWLLDVQSFMIEKQKIKIDKSLLNKFGDIPRNEEFFKNHFAKKVCGRVLDKQILAVTLLSPLKILLEDGRELWGVQNVLFAGDPGQSKTVLSNEVLTNYCGQINNAKLISVENSTNRGLIGAVVKNPITNGHMIRLGHIPKCDKGFVVLDGFGKLSSRDYSELRGLQEEKQIQINKAASIKKECALRLVCLGNLLSKVSNYSTRHRASFDIAATTDDETGKFAGADRRRYAHVSIIAQEDISTNETDQHYLQLDSNELEETKKYWTNLRAFAWSRNANAFQWEKGLLDYAATKLSELRKDYEIFSLDYGILSKGGFQQFLGQLPGVAILHESINDEIVLINKKHVDWLIELYKKEFNHLGLDQELFNSLFYEAHATLIISKASEELKEVLNLLFRYGSQVAIEKAKIKSRMDMWRTLNKAVEYQIQYEGDKEPTTVYYTCNVGNSELPQLNKRDGTITEFGRILLKKAAELSKPKLKRIVTPVTPVTPNNVKIEKSNIIYNDNINNDNNILCSVSSVSSVTNKDNPYNQSSVSSVTNNTPPVVASVAESSTGGLCSYCKLKPCAEGSSFCIDCGKLSDWSNNWKVTEVDGP